MLVQIFGFNAQLQIYTPGFLFSKTSGKLKTVFSLIKATRAENTSGFLF